MTDASNMHEFYYMFKRFIFMMLKDPHLQAIGLETWETLDKELHNKDLAQEIQRDLVTPIGAFCSYLLREYHFLVFVTFQILEFQSSLTPPLKTKIQGFIFKLLDLVGKKNPKGKTTYPSSFAFSSKFLPSRNYSFGFKKLHEGESLYYKTHKNDRLRMKLIVESARGMLVM